MNKIKIQCSAFKFILKIHNICQWIFSVDFWCQSKCFKTTNDLICFFCAFDHGRMIELFGHSQHSNRITQIRIKDEMRINQILLIILWLRLILLYLFHYHKDLSQVIQLCFIKWQIESNFHIGIFHLMFSDLKYTSCWYLSEKMKVVLSETLVFHIIIAFFDYFTTLNSMKSLAFLAMLREQYVILSK